MANILKPLETPMMQSNYLSEPRPLISDYTLYHDIYTTNLKANFASGLITSTKTILGSGLIFLPLVLGYSGWVTGCLIIFFGFGFSFISSNLLIECLINSPFPCSYQVLADSITPNLIHFVNFALFIDSFGACCTYLIFIGKLCSHVLHNYGFSGIWTKDLVWIVVGFAISIPLSFVKYLSTLTILSLFSLFSIILLIITQFLFTYKVQGLDPCKNNADSCEGVHKPYTNCLESIACIPIVIFAFNFHSNIFSVANEIENFSIKKLREIVMFSLLVSLVVGIVVAAHAYFLYGNHIDDIFFFNYPDTEIINLIMILFAFVFVFNLPLQIHPIRKTCYFILQKVFQRDYSQDDVDLHHILITIFLLCLVIVVSLTVENLKVLISVIGATGSNAITMILPSYIFYNMRTQETEKWKVALSVLIFCLGVALMPITLFALFYDK